MNFLSWCKSLQEFKSLAHDIDLRELQRRALELKCDIAVPAQIKEGLLPIQHKN